MCCSAHVLYTACFSAWDVNRVSLAYSRATFCVTECQCFRAPYTVAAYQNQPPHRFAVSATSRCPSRCLSSSARRLVTLFVACHFGPHHATMCSVWGRSRQSYQCFETSIGNIPCFLSCVRSNIKLSGRRQSHGGTRRGIYKRGISPSRYTIIRSSSPNINSSSLGFFLCPSSIL